jgi:hypothetical protein
MQRTITELQDKAVRGLLTEQRAAYLHQVDAASAQRMLTRALADNPFVLRPAAGVTPTQLKAAAVQAAAAAEFLTAEYQDGMALVLGVRALTDEIVWGDEDRTDDAEAAWEQLGRHLGLASTRPEKLYGTGPDNLWALSSSRHAVIELKTGSSTDTISKSDLDQLGGSVRWDEKTHRGADQVPVMVHPSDTIHDKGIAVPGMRVVTEQTWERLKQAVRGFAVALADGQGRWKDETAVAEQLAYAKLTAGNFFQTYAVAPRSTAR